MKALVKKHAEPGLWLEDVHDQHGPEGARFWTKAKQVTQRWPDGSVTGESAFVIPTMG